MTTVGGMGAGQGTGWTSSSAYVSAGGGDNGCGGGSVANSYYNKYGYAGSGGSGFVIIDANGM